MKVNSFSPWYTHSLFTEDNRLPFAAYLSYDKYWITSANNKMVELKK